MIRTAYQSFKNKNLKMKSYDQSKVDEKQM